MAHTKNYSQHRKNFALYFWLQFRTAAFLFMQRATHQHNNTHTTHTHTLRRVAWAIFTHYITHLPYNFAACLCWQSITAAAAPAMSIDRDLSHKHTHTHVIACVTWTCVHNYNVCMCVPVYVSLCVCMNISCKSAASTAVTAAWAEAEVRGEVLLLLPQGEASGPHCRHY